MIMRIVNALVNYPHDSEFDCREYKMDRPDWEFSSMMAEIGKQHPSASSVIITLVRVEKNDE